MLSGRKENQSQFSQVFDSHRKSSSTCRQILKQICQESQYSQLRKRSESQELNLPTASIKQMQLKEALSFLQKKSDKQNEQLIFLTEEICKMKSQREEDLEFLKNQKDKSKRMQTTINTQAKTIADLKKKNQQIGGFKSDFQKKIAEQQAKLFKLKQLLRKKESQVLELQEQNGNHANLDKILSKQKEQLASMRENYFRIKSKEDQLQEQNKRLKIKIEQLSQEKTAEREKVWGLEEINRRLEDQCSELQDIYEDSRKQASEAENQLRLILEEQTKQITRLRDATSKIQQIDAGQDTESSVYWKQIVRILKQSILDKNLRTKLEKQIQDVVICMEQSWNKILMQVVATTATDDL